MDPGLSAHSSIIQDQFTRQAHGFSVAPELHNDAVLSLLIDQARPAPTDRALDIACGPGTVVAGFSPHWRSLKDWIRPKPCLQKPKHSQLPSR